MASIFKRDKKSKIWYLSWYDELGERQKKSLGKISKQEANIQKAAKELELSTGQVLMPAKILFDVFVVEYRAWFDAVYPSSADRTEQIIRIHLSPVFGHMALNQITLKDGEQYIAKRVKEKAPAGTIEKEVRKLNAIINKAVTYKYVEENPLKGIEIPQDLESKPPPYFQVEEVQLVIAKSVTHAHWWSLMVNTGIRRKEAFQIKHEHIKDNKLHVLSTSTARTKSGKWREIPLNQAALDAVKVFKQNKIKGSAFLFPRINIKSISRAFVEDVKKANRAIDKDELELEKLDGTLHWLRHTFISHLVMNGKTLSSVQVLAGHASHKTTEKYRHLSPEHLKDATDSLKF